MKPVIWKIVASALVCVIAAGAGGPICDDDAFYKAFPNYDKRIKGEPTKESEHAMDVAFAEYGGPHWCQNCLGGCHKGNEIPAGMAKTYVHIGCGNGKRATHYRFKVIVHQDNPCFIVDRYFPRYSVTITKIDSHTVEITGKKDDWCDLFLSNYGRVGEDSLYSKPKGKDVKMILGNNLSCVYENNIERWEIFVKDGNGWKPFHTETFVIRKDHPVARWVREHSK